MSNIWPLPDRLPRDCAVDPRLRGDDRQGEGEQGDSGQEDAESEDRAIPVKLHLSRGGEPMAGWTHIDIANADPPHALPYPNDSVAAIHIGPLPGYFDAPEAALALLSDAHRALCRGGVIRITVPDTELTVRARGALDSRLFIPVADRGDRPHGGDDTAALATLLDRAGFSAIRRCQQGDSGIEATASTWPFALIMEARV